MADKKWSEMTSAELPDAAEAEQTDAIRRETFAETAHAMNLVADIWERDGSDPCRVRITRKYANAYRVYAEGLGEPTGHAARLRETRASDASREAVMRESTRTGPDMEVGEPMTAPTEEPRDVIDAAHLAHQRAWSEQTFGPGLRLGVIDHIRKELDEVSEDPTDLSEWVDVIILGFDGAWRAGHEPQAIIDGIKAKQARNEARSWPDWRTLPTDKAIEHHRIEGGDQ